MLETKILNQVFDGKCKQITFSRMVLSSRQGYNLIAPYYDAWKWQFFWRCNEWPYMEKWCNTLKIGRGADLGAGTGNNLKHFIDLGHQVVAYDISEMMLAICKHKYTQEIATRKLTCIVKDIKSLSIHQQEFDWMICNRVLSHISDVSTVVRRIARGLKQHGECFISDVHPLHDYDYTHFRIGEKDIIIETYKHSLKELNQLFYKNGLSIVDFKEISQMDLFEKNIAHDFHSIKNETTPIFYYYILKKI